jgi:hypothetical protein
MIANVAEFPSSYAVIGDIVPYFCDAPSARMKGAFKNEYMGKFLGPLMTGSRNEGVGSYLAICDDHLTHSGPHYIFRNRPSRFIFGSSLACKGQSQLGQSLTFA